MTPSKRQQVPNYISLKVCDELYALVAREADRLGIKMIDVAVAAVANSFNRPDLAVVPRKPQGRKRLKVLTNGHSRKPAGVR